MKDTEKRIQVVDFIEGDDSSVTLKVSLVYCLNNIGQRLYELIECYRFFFLGLGSSEDDFRAFTRSIELSLSHAEKVPFASLQKSASFLLSSNFIVNLIQLVNDELKEILIVLHAWRLAKAKTKYSDLKSELERLRSSLERQNLPGLIERLEREVGTLALRDHLASINKVRRAYVHCKGRVEDEALELKLHVPTMLALYPMSMLQHPSTSPRLTREIAMPREASMTWKQGEYIGLDYEACFKIAFTVLSFFGNAILVRAASVFPELVPANQAL